MNWFIEHRQNWIGEMLEIYGFINRIHLRRKFGCSAIQASLDLTAFAARHPDKAQYDNRRKAYIHPERVSDQNPLCARAGAEVAGDEQ